MKRKILEHFLLFVLTLVPFSTFGKNLEISEVSFLSINSAITPATLDYLDKNFKTLPKNTLILLQINTPGGLVTTTKDIITLTSSQNKPVAVWIGPEGASASSAGAIIASAAHFIFMSPGTNIGAATPVEMGEDIKEGDGRKKALNDLSALIRSLSESRKRPTKPFEEMITEARSFTDQEALKLGIINGVISQKSDILNFINGKTIHLDGEEVVINIQDPTYTTYELTLGQKILEVLANPSTAYILFLIGVALLYFEFQAPGGFIAGAVGLCFLILAAISFQILPLNWGAFGLILAGMFLLVLEIFIISYGMLSLAGIISFTLGSLFLFDAKSGFMSIEYPVILSTLAGGLTGLGIMTWYLLKERKKNHAKTNFFLPLRSKGVIMSQTNENEFQIKVQGQIWRAYSDDKFSIGDRVVVSDVDTKTLTVQIKKES